MIHKPTLLVLAAGMATRYGGLKQIDRFGPNGETIIDYSVYDAIKAGFGKIVFVIRKSIGKEFHDFLIERFSDKVQVETVFQELDILPEGFASPENRTKPWGTGHAVWVASSMISGPFSVINADDFYGYRSFKAMADFLIVNTDDHQYSLVGYQLSNTLSKNGAVSRGICSTDNRNYLESVVEQTHIIETEKGIVTQGPDSQETLLSGNEVVSMNMMGFNPSVFPYFESYFKSFLSEKSRDVKAEFYLPQVVNNLARSGKARIKVLFSSEKWFGVTYPDDKPLAVKNLKDLTEAGVYPLNLWKG